MLPAFKRRSFVAALAGGITARRAIAAPASFPEAATLLVAGPAGSRADRWAELLAAPLGRALQQGAALPRQNVGGPDGVTGANQFEAHAMPDGSTALLVPGTAALSWLAGDARVKFDAAHWIPVWAGSVSSAMASRVRLAPGQRVRCAVGQTIGPELAGWLALELLGMDVIPVRNPSGRRALPGPDVDVVFLQGAALRDGASALAANVMALAFGFGALNATGEIVRDPAFPDLPTVQETISRTRPDASARLRAGLHAMTSAVQLDLALALPQLSPAAIVAWWRRGCATLGQSPDLQAEAARIGLRPANPMMAGVNLAAIAVDVPVLLDLRRWLSERYQWQPA